MTAPTDSRTPHLDDVAAAWRSVLTWGAGVLVLSIVLLLVLRTSANPAPGSFAYEAVAWVQDVATLVGSVLLGAAVVLRQLTRR